jgi:hypothetical protein
MLRLFIALIDNKDYNLLFLTLLLCGAAFVCRNFAGNIPDDRQSHPVTQTESRLTINNACQNQSDHIQSVNKKAKFKSSQDQLRSDKDAVESFTICAIL